MVDLAALVLPVRSHWTARVVQYQDGVELLLERAPRARVMELLLTALALLLGIFCVDRMGAGAGLGWAAAFGLCGAFGLSGQQDRPMRRCLLAHAQSESFLLHDGQPGSALGGGATADLSFCVDAAPGGKVQLRIFSASGEQELGGTVLLDDRAASQVRRFLALSGIRVHGRC